jgi:polysaccharide pyruvyl transferase WcaK-like protein
MMGKNNSLRDINGLFIPPALRYCAAVPPGLVGVWLIIVPRRFQVNVSFVGWYGRSNCGDEAFKEAHRVVLPDAALAWFCEERLAANPDTRFVLGGGDVFLDYYLDCIPADANFWVYGVGIGGTREYDLVVAHKHRINGIWLRNRGDVEVLNGLGVQAHYTPDSVFNLRKQTLAWVRPPRGLLPRLYVILSNNLYQSAQREGLIGRLCYLEYFKHELASSLDWLAQFYQIILMPFSTDPNDFDPGFCADVYSLMHKFNRKTNGDPAVRFLGEAPSPMKALEMLHGADMVLTMKFHGLVFATLLGVPFVNIGLSRKNQMFCADNGLSHLSIEDYSFSKDRLLEKVKAAESPEARLAVQNLGAELAGLAEVAAAKFRESLRAS